MRRKRELERRRTSWKRLRYRTPDRWLDARGREFQPTPTIAWGQHEVWGSVWYRLRREDFDATHEHRDGISPAWPIDYDTLEPYYERADACITCTDRRRGSFGGATRAVPLPRPPACGRDGSLVSLLRRRGLPPSPLPLG